MKEIKITFEVKKIIFRNEENGYSIVNVNLKKHPKDIKIPTAEPVVVGYFQAIHVKDEFEALGKWVDAKENGYQFYATLSQLVFPETSKGIVEFLKRFVDGVGEVTARRVVDAFKEDTFNVILNNPEKLCNIKGITKRKAEAMYRSILKHKGYEDVAMFLIPLGLSHTETVFIYDKLGYEAINKIKENPYVLCFFDKISFMVVDKLAKRLGNSSNNKERIKHGIMFYIKKQMENRGDMFVYKEDIINELPGFLKYNGAFKNSKITKEEIKLALGELVLMKKIDIEKNDKNRECVYLSFYKHIENEIVRMINETISIPYPSNYLDKNISLYIKDYENSIGFKLAQNQKRAIYMAMKNRLSILSGGPGTGKTQTINAIIYCLKRVKPNMYIELCAPTGRAAKRMTELTGMKAKTIHRLIGLNNFSQDDLELIDIEADFLIIDEASMIDAYVFYNLLSVISNHTKILIVGDYEQLPSVGAGLILRDLISSSVIPTTTLTEIFRQAENSQIVINSYKVINGIKTTDENGIKFDEGKGDFYFIENKSINYINFLILKSIERLLKTGYTLDNIQVLSVMNKGDLGVIELNRKIQEKFNPQKKGLAEIEIGNHRYLRENDKVMQTKNNYELGVFNGEVGKISFINIDLITDIKDFELIVDFGDKEISYSLEDVSELTLAYAITVHKSQGSEFDVVIMPFHSSLSILLNRNLIYTGWTRAKKRVICIGDIEELNRGIDRVDNTVRNSQVKEKLVKLTKNQQSHSALG